MAMDLPIFGQTQTKPATPTLSLTSAAADQVRELLAKRGTPEHGLRVGVRGGGCSGNSYFMEYCEAPGPEDQIDPVEGLDPVGVGLRHPCYPQLHRSLRPAGT